MSSSDRKALYFYFVGFAFTPAITTECRKFNIYDEERRVVADVTVLSFAQSQQVPKTYRNEDHILLSCPVNIVCNIQFASAPSGVTNFNKSLDNALLIGTGVMARLGDKPHSVARLIKIEKVELPSLGQVNLLPC